MQTKIPCTIMRGGTSKGLYLLAADLPAPGPVRDALLMRIMGTPDARQIDGLGGATSVTSKIAIIAPSARADADVDYTFAQIAVNQPTVSYAGNCGNISSGVGPFAIEAGLVPAIDGETLVRIYNTNTDKIMHERIRVVNGRVDYSGDASIPGVPGTAAPIRVEVIDPAGAVCKALLPTGNPTDILRVEGLGEIEVSLVDAANPLVFMRASDLGLTGTELPAQIDGDPELLSKLELIRGTAAVKLGFVDTPDEAVKKSPGVPKMTLLAPPTDYTTTTGRSIPAKEMDIQGRMMSMQKAHQTYALTGAMCTAAAAATPGTLVNRLMRPGADVTALRIAQPGGVIEAGAVSEDGAIKSAYGVRTARLLMRGEVYFPEEILSDTK